MASRVYLEGDPAAVLCIEAPDVVMDLILESRRKMAGTFIALELPPILEGEPTTTGYILPDRIVAVLPSDRREVQWFLENPPEWATA